MNNSLVVPAQIRAGRALLEWSQDDLAKEAEVGLSTVRDIESERRAADTAAVASIRRALWNAGVIFVTGDADGGPGARLVGNWPNIIRRPTTFVALQGMPLTVEWKGKAITVLISREVLDDLDRHSGGTTVDEYLKTFDRHRGKILDAITLSIENPENFDSYGYLHIRPEHIEAVEAQKWCKVVIDKAEYIRDSEAKALMNKFVSRYIAAGVPKNVEVFRGETPSGGYVYYFSPPAARMAKDLLDSFCATACTTIPNVATLRRQRF